MNTETTENFRGWVCYNADCALCRRWARRAHELLARRGWHLAPLQAQWVCHKLGLQEGEVVDEMKLLAADGQVLGGADAFIRLTCSIWWAWPLFAMVQLPGAKPILRAAYRRLAKNRHCLAGQCALPPVNEERHRHLTSSFYEIP